MGVDQLLKAGWVDELALQRLRRLSKVAGALVWNISGNVVLKTGKPSSPTRDAVWTVLWENSTRQTMFGGVDNVWRHSGAVKAGVIAFHIWTHLSTVITLGKNIEVKIKKDKFDLQRYQSQAIIFLIFDIKDRQSLICYQNSFISDRYQIKFEDENLVFKYMYFCTVSFFSCFRY